MYKHKYHTARIMISAVNKDVICASTTNVVAFISNSLLCCLQVKIPEVLVYLFKSAYCTANLLFLYYNFLIINQASGDSVFLMVNNAV